MPNRSMGHRRGLWWKSVRATIILAPPPTSAGTSATYVRVPTAMEFHPARYDINLRRINALVSPPFPLRLSFSILAP